MSLFIVIMCSIVVAVLSAIWSIGHDSILTMFISGFFAGLAFVLITKACFGG